MMRALGFLTPVVLALLALGTPERTVGQQVAEVQLAPSTVTMAIGERRELLADAFNGRGDIVTSASFTWTSSDPAVVRVTADPDLPGIAVLTGLREGLANVEVRAGNRRASAAVQVAGIGGAQAATVGGELATILQIEPASIFLLPSEEIRPQPRFLNNDGDLAAPTAVTWRFLGQPGVAEIRDQGGVLGLSPGQGVLEATTQTGLLARVTVQVAQNEFAFTSDRLGLSPNLSDTVSVTVPDQNERSLAPDMLVWRSTNMSIVHVSPLGVVTGRGAGQAEVIATGFGQESRLPVTVHRPVEYLEASPPYSNGSVAVPLGGALTFSVNAMTADESSVPEAPLTWVLADTTIATFDAASGELTGNALGQTRLAVRGPGRGLEVVWQVEIVAGGLAVDPQLVSIGRGDQRKLDASFTDDSGTPVAEASSLTWASSDTMVVGVDAEGNLLPNGIGSTLVAASTPWGSTDTATVHVIGEILVTSTRAGNVELYSFDRDQPELFHQVTESPGSELAAEYCPDGSKIAYVSDLSGNLDIYVANVDGTDAVQVTSTVSLEGAPSWTPDGSSLLYESDQSGETQIWFMNADGTGQVQLTSGEEPNYRPAVSPDGANVIFVCSDDDRYDICQMNLDGSNQQNLTQSDVNELYPAWLSDTTIAFIQEQGRGRNMIRMIVQMALNVTGEIVPVFGQGMMVTDFATSANGDLIAASVSAQGSEGLENRLYLIPTGPDGVPIEVPRADDRDQLVSPTFRRW